MSDPVYKYTCNDGVFYIRPTTDSPSSAWGWSGHRTVELVHGDSELWIRINRYVSFDNLTRVSDLELILLKTDEGELAEG